ncbi:MAG: hypothetical protein OEX12_00025 [Gammaproteobacteria bacterium]|nr:hypothetical protein [Gammaproteobacteria bacterium]
MALRKYFLGLLAEGMSQVEGIDRKEEYREVALMIKSFWVKPSKRRREMDTYIRRANPAQAAQLIRAQKTGDDPLFLLPSESPCNKDDFQSILQVFIEAVDRCVEPCKKYKVLRHIICKAYSTKSLRRTRLAFMACRSSSFELLRYSIETDTNL